MKLPKAWLFELTIVVLADVLIGYLTVETLDALTGAQYSLPISSFLVDSVGLTPLVAGAVVGAALFSFSALFVYWLWKHTPGFISRYFGSARDALKGVPEKARDPLDGAMKVGDLQLAEGAEKPFVDVVQLEGYPLNIYAAVTKEEGREGYTYVVIEPTLSEPEKARLTDLKKLLVDELDVDLRSIETSEKAERYLSEKVRELAKKYGYKVSPATMTKLLYYLTRDFIHLGKIEPLMRDKLIEDISCDGAGIPIYIWYRDYESIPTNISFETAEELDTYVSKLAYSAGKHVSLAEPIVDASLADGSRLHLTYGKEITQRGSTFTIRKFRVDPLTIVDLIRYNTLSSDIAAYLWYLIEKKLALLIAGGTASGKTTTLNALSMFIEPGEKIVSVEDSVTGDAELLVKEAGAVRKVSIGSYIDDALRLGSVKTDKGHELARTHELEVLTSDETGKTGWSRCTALIRHRVDKELVKVTTRTGKTITVTEDHSLFSLGDAGSVEEILAGVLAPGSFIATPRAFPHERTKHEFNLERLAAFSDYVFKTSNDNGNGLVLQPRVHAEHSPPSTPSLLLLDDDIAFLAGLWLADGFYGDRTVGFSVEEKRLGPRLAEVASKLEVNLTRHSDGVSLLMNSKPLKTFFETVLGISGDDYSRRVPDLFFDADEVVVASLLRGYFTGDGSANASEVEVESASRTLLTDLQTLLLRFGLTLTVGTKRKVGSLGGIGTFRAKIVGASQVAIFKEKIGFEDETKMAKLLPRRKTSKYFLDPIPLNESLAGEIREQLAGITQTALGQRLRKGLKRGVVHRDTLLELGRVRQRYRESRGFALAGSSYYFDRVVSVEKERRDETVYDLSVPETGRFIANNILCHNTPELNLPHENWIQSVTRGVGTAGEITMFDLLKASLRQRPDVLIVGEVRGEEAFTLLQSIASVTGDTDVMVRRDGVTSLTGIGGLVDGAYEGDRERIPVALDGVEVLTFDSQNRIVFAPVQYALRHRADEIYCVRYSGGLVKATGSHSVFVFDEDGNLTAKPVKELAQGDVLASFCGSEVPRKAPVIMVRELLEGEGSERLVQSRGRATCPKCGSMETIRKGRYFTDWRYTCNGCGRVFNGKTQPVRLQNELLQPDGTVLVAFARSRTLPPAMEVDNEFAEVLGVYLADGCVKHDGKASRIVFSLGKGEKEVYVPVLNSFFDRFGTRPTVDDRGTYVLLDYNHTLLAEVFESLCGAKLAEKRLPDFIWNAPVDLVVAFLEGWKADARRKTKRTDVGYTSARPDLVRSISWLARMNGMTSFISERSSKYQSVYTSAKPGAKNRAIPAAPFVKLKRLLRSSAWRYSPKPRAKTIRKIVAERALEEIIAKRRGGMTEESERLVQTIRGLISSSMIASRVLKVERSAFEGYVYDLSVPQTEAFFGGESPVALHNTGHGGLGTIHADSVEATINRLTTEPMNIPRSLVGTTLDCIVMQLKIRLADRSVRRVVAVTEVVGHDSRTDEIILNDAFKWDPVVDRFTFTGRSKLFDKITQKFGTRPEEIRREIDGRKVFLDWLVAKNIRGHAEVSNQVREFYAGPYAVINKAKVELEDLKA